MTSYKFVSLKDLNDPNSFHSKSVTNISSSEQINKTISSDPKENEYASKIKKSSSTNEINNGRSSSKREYNFESSSKPFKSEMEKTNNDRTKDPVIGKSINNDRVPSFSFLKDDWFYKTPPSHHDKSDFKSSFESMYNYFDGPTSEISHDQKKCSFARSDPLLYKGKEFSSTYEKSNYECNEKSEERSSNIREHSFASSIPDYRFPPSHHDKYDGYLKHGGHDYQDTFDTYLRKKPENRSQNSSQIGSTSSIHSESKTEYDKLEEHSEYFYHPEPPKVKHLIKDEIDLINLTFDDNAFVKNINTGDFSTQYFQVHKNPRVYPQSSREVNNKVDPSSRSETIRKKPIVHYMLPESGIRKPAVQTKKPVNLSNTAPRGSHREKYRVENFYDVDTKVVNSNLSSNSIYKERVSSSDSKKCSCIPGSKNSKKPIVIYTYTYENDPSKLVNPPKKLVKPVNKRNIVLTSPKPSKTQSLENVSTIFSTEYLNRRFFDDHQLNKLRKSETSELNLGARLSASSKSCLVNRGSTDNISLSSLNNIVKRQTSREGLQKHVTFSDLVSLQSYSDHEEFTSTQYSEVSDNTPAPPPPPPSFSAPPPPPSMNVAGAPPPPPVFGGHIPTMRLKSEISDRKEPPAAIQNAMMTKDKKPFTYTPGGIDLSEIRSPRMAKRIVRNQNAPDTHIPQTDASKPKLALTPGAQAAMQPQVAFPVFPSGQAPSLPSHGGNQQNGSSESPQQKTVVPQQTLPPPPPQRSSQLLNSPLSEGTPKANLPWLQKAPQQKELPPWVHDNSDTQYSSPTTQQQLEGRNTPTLQQQQQYNTPSPQPSAQQYQPQHKQQLRPSPLTQPNSTSQPQPPSRWVHPPSNQQALQQDQREPQWQQPLQPQKQWQPVTPQRTESPAPKRWPQQSETPVQKQWPSQQQTEIPVQRQQQQWQAPQTIEIPVQKEAPSTWQPTSPQTSAPPQWHNVPPPPQRAQTPQPQRDVNSSQTGHNVRVIPIQIENSSNGRRSQPSSPQINGNGTPIQSKSFKVLQKVTNTDASEFLEGDSFSIDGVPFSQFSNVHISDQGNFKTNENQPQYSRAQTDPRYTGDKIPSRSFQILQAITQPYEDMKIDMKAPFEQVPQVQVRIMTNVPRSGPSTPQPSDNGPPQYIQQSQGNANTSSHTYQVRQAMTTSQFSDCTEREVNGYYPYPPLPPPPPSPHYLPPSRPSSTPPYPSPLYPPPTPPPVTPPPTPEQYQQMWQHFNNFYAYYYQQPPAQFYYPPPPPYPSSTYSFTYPSDTEDGYSGYSSTEEMNGYFNNIQKQRQYQQKMRGAHIESVENSETEYETSDSEKPNEYQVKLYDESEEDTEYPMTTSMESADSVVGDYLSTIVEESEISDKKSQCSDCTLEKLSEDDEEINTDEEVVFVKLPLSVKRKDEVTTITVGNSREVQETNTDLNNKKTESNTTTEKCIATSNSMRAENHLGNSNNNQFVHLTSEIESVVDSSNDVKNTLYQDSHKYQSKEYTKKASKNAENDNVGDINLIETYEEKKVKEKRVKNTETKISISYNGIKDEKILNAVTKRTNKNTKSVFTSRLSGENFDFDCWNESDLSQQEEILDDATIGNGRCNKSDFDNMHEKGTMEKGKQRPLLKQNIVKHTLGSHGIETNVSFTIKFPLKITLPTPKNGTMSIIQPNEVFDSAQKCNYQKGASTCKDHEEYKTPSHNSSRCESPSDENSQSSVMSHDNSSSRKSCEEENIACSFLQNLSSILQNIKMSKSMEKEEISQSNDKQELATTVLKENSQQTAPENFHEVGTLQETIMNNANQEDLKKSDMSSNKYAARTECDEVSDVDDNKSDEVDFWAEIGQSEDHMHLSMTKSQHEEFDITPETDIRETVQSSHIINKLPEDSVTNNLNLEYIHEEYTPECSNSDDDESLDGTESESKSESSEDSTTSSEDSTLSSSSCEEDEEEGRTFVFYHDNEQKMDTSQNDLHVSNPPEIRIQSNDEQQSEFHFENKNILDYTPSFEEMKPEAITCETSSIRTEQYNPCEVQEIHEKSDANNTLNVEERRRSSQYSYESEEDDSGVTSDISRQISETDTDHDQEFTELKKMSTYKRANTHSRLYQLLQDECDFEKSDTSLDTAIHNKEKLSLPLGCNSIDNSNVSTPTSPIVSEKLVKELVQSLLNKKKGRIFRNLPTEKLHAAAIRILQEDIDYDTFSSTSGESSLLESPADHSPTATPLQRATHRGAYANYSEYYETWASASVRESLGSDIIPSRAFKILQEHVKPGIGPGFIEGLQAKCPKVSSATNLPSVMEARDSLTPVPENYP